VSISKTIHPDHVAHFKESRVPDMTPQEQYAAELSARAAQRLGALGEMTGGIAHDFRNILAIIESGLTLIERHSGDPEKVRVFVAKAREGVDRGARLTAQLLTFAKEHDLGVRVENINGCLEDLELFLKSGAGPEIRIVLQLAADIPRCLIDRAQFNAAILNLVVNARDALPKGGSIEISTERWAVNTMIVDAPPPGIYVRV
jgi:signal transduction histidine kinase